MQMPFYRSWNTHTHTHTVDPIPAFVFARIRKIYEFEMFASLVLSLCVSKYDLCDDKQSGLYSDQECLFICTLTLAITIFFHSLDRFRGRRVCVCACAWFFFCLDRALYFPSFSVYLRLPVKNQFDKRCTFSIRRVCFSFHTFFDLPSFGIFFFLTAQTYTYTRIHTTANIAYINPKTYMHTPPSVQRFDRNERERKEQIRNEMKTINGRSVESVVFVS